MLKIEDFVPSSKWTDEDRLVSINELASRIYDYQMNMFRDHNVSLDAIERISLISSKSTLFLEANRKSILDGQA